MLGRMARGTVDVVSSIAADVPARRRIDWRTPVRWFGLLCLMGAAFFGGYVVWLLWGTGLETRRAQDSLRPGIEQQIAHPHPPPAAGQSVHVLPGDAYAVIQIPRIDLDMVVVQGTDYTSLKEGPGHYLDTADPWDGTGRVGIAGHRTTYLHPFFDLDQVQPGDTITLLTAYGTYTYTVTKNFVLPEATAGVVLEQTQEPTLVLTTCNPRYASSERLIVEADLTGSPA
jgi:LPXTG-site transpeptidase (sortase) family protein